jgi:peroxiredoxin
VREIADLAEPSRPSLDSSGYVDLESSDVPLAAVTDADGRFVLRGLPPDIRATVVVDDDRYLRRESYIATSDEPQRDLVEWPTRPGAGKPRVVPVHLWYSQIKVERAYRVHGRVVFADTGKPVAGAGWNEPPILSPPKGTTGADGRFTLRRLPPGKIALRITPPAGSGYLGVASTIELSGDNYEVEQTVELPPGEEVQGRVVDAKSGNGIGRATIWYVGQQPPSPGTQRFVEKVQSDADGRFAVGAPPGKAELIVIGPVPGYLSYARSGSVTWAPAEFHRPIEVRPGQTQADVTFELQPNPNATLSAQVIDAEGKGAEGVEIRYHGFGEQDGFGVGGPPAQLTSDVKGSFVLKDLEPSFEYDLRLLDRQRGLGSYVLLSQLGQPKAPLTIELEPLATANGQVVDEEGRPIPGAVARLYSAQGRHSHVDGDPVATDVDGRFEFRILPGAAYSVQTSADGYASKHDARFTLASGERHTLRVVLPRADQEVAGVLVDAQGKPVAGARVFARSMLADLGLKARTKTRLTDSQGRFQLAGLPRGPAEVNQSFDQFDTRQSTLGQVTAGASNLRFIVADGGRPLGEGRVAEKRERVPAVRLVDSDGQPVASAWVGVGALGDSERTPVWSPYSPKGSSGDDGRAEIVGRLLPNGQVVLYARHEAKNLAALQAFSREELLNAPEMVLLPACHVSGRLTSEALVEAGQNLGWTNVYLYRGNDRPLSFMSKQQRFDFYLPPDKYRLAAYGADTLTVERDIEVAAGQAELEVGAIDLPATKLATLIGKPAPELRDIKGWKNSSGVTLSELRGKYVLLDFWGYWCKPCTRHMLHLMKLHDSFGDRGLAVIAVHDASVESIADMDGKLNQQRGTGSVREGEWWGRDLPFPVALDGGTPVVPAEGDRWHGATTEAYGISIFPTTLLIDREGKIVKQVTAWDANLPDELARLLGVAGKPPTWRGRFDQVYQLAPGEVLRHVSVPFLPERTSFITERNALGDPGQWPGGEWPERLTLEWDGTALHSAGSGDASLSSLLGSLAGWGQPRDTFECPEELAGRKIPGDWIVARDAPLAKRLEALDRVLQNELPKPLRIERKQVEREVVAVRGQYRFVPLRPEDKYIHVSTGDRDLDDVNGGGSGAFSEWLDWMSSLTGIRFIAETEQPPDLKLQWYQHPSTVLDKPSAAERLDLVLANLARQTSLEFDRQRRLVDVWSVREDR